MRPLMLSLTAVVVIGGIAVIQSRQTPDRPKTGEIDRYFTSPQASVPVIAKLLKAQDWATLASYYDLAGTQVDERSLKDGTFFVTDERPESAHPGGFWRYKQPFAPGFSFQSAKAAGEDRIEVTVAIEIDEGGGMVQRGLDTYRLIAHPEGYQLLPE